MITDKMRLGVNVDHVATIRNARGGKHPDPLKAAKLAINSGADSIVVHLREDRRHISDDDLINLMKELDKPITLEMAATNEMVDIACESSPKKVCFVPEKREERTTEGGLDVCSSFSSLQEYIAKLKSHNMDVSLFIEPDVVQINAAKELNATAVELHTGEYCNAFDSHDVLNIQKELIRLEEASAHGYNLGLEINAGHGLNYASVASVSKIKQITELNIGHFIIGESLFVGIEDAVREMRLLIDTARQS